MADLSSLFTLDCFGDRAMLVLVNDTCTHAERDEGKCPRCGRCEHELVLNGACYYCGETDLQLTIKPAASDLVQLTGSKGTREP